MKVNNHFLTLEAVEKLHRATLKVLKEVGVRFDQDEAVERFKEKGFLVRGRQVFFQEHEIQEALDKVPQKFILSGRTSTDDVQVGEGKTIFAPASGPVYIQRDGKRNTTTAQDYIDLLKIYQTSKEVPVINANMTEPQDLPFEERDVFRLKKCLEMTTKPLMGFTTGKVDSRRCVKMIKEFYNNNEGHYVLGIISPVSPLCYDESMIEGMEVYAQENQPLLIASCSLPGATSPVTIAGSLVTNNAEVLAGVVYSQLLRPGLPVIYGGTTPSCDMRMVSPAIGSPETGLMTYGVRALSAYYGLPCRSGGSLTDANQLDMQAGIESTYTLLSAAMAGIDFVVQSCGIMESFNVLSFEKVIIDEENIRLAKRYVRGFEVTDEKIAYDIIAKVGSQGTYITEDHTFQNFKDDFSPAQLMSKEGFDQWQEKGSPSLVDKAKNIIVKRIEQYREPILSEEQKKYLSQIGGQVNEF